MRIRLKGSFSDNYSDGQDMDGFIKKTDDALYKAKSKGKNRVEVFLIFVSQAKTSL